MTIEICPHGGLRRKCELCDAYEDMDEAVRFIRVLGEELAIDGHPSGDRTVILATVRALLGETAMLRRANAELIDQCNLMRDAGTPHTLRAWILALDAHKCGEEHLAVNTMQRELRRDRLTP